MTAPFTLPIPTYQSRARVQALRIKAVVPNPRGYELHFEDERFVPMEVMDPWNAEHNLGPGGYVVWHEGGHVSVSPAAAFEAGYTLVEERQPVQQVLSDDLSKCQRSLMEAGKPFPKTCPVCGLGGKCKRDEVGAVGPATQAAREAGE